MIRLIHGDAIEEMKKLSDKSIDCCIADMPYGTTQNRWDTVLPLPEMWEQLCRVVKDDGAIVLFSQMPFSAILVSSNLKMFKYNWVWHKSRVTGFLNAKKYPLKYHEEIQVFCKKPHVYNPQFSKGKPYNAVSGAPSDCYGKYKQVVNINTGTRYPKSILKFNSVQKTIHATQKPVDLLEYLIKTYTNENETVLDFCMGSGSTGVAAINTKRKFIGIELDRDIFKTAFDRINE